MVLDFKHRIERVCVFEDKCTKQYSNTLETPLLPCWVDYEKEIWPRGKPTSLTCLGPSPWTVLRVPKPSHSVACMIQDTSPLLPFVFSFIIQQCLQVPLLCIYLATIYLMGIL